MVNKEINRILNSFGAEEDERLTALPPLQYRVLRMKFYELKTWKEISEETGYCIRQLYRIRDEAFEALNSK